MKNRKATTALVLALELAFALFSGPSPAAEPACADALEDLEIELNMGELPESGLVGRIVDSCPADVGALVQQQVMGLRIVVLTSQVKRMDADRIESYGELKRTLGKAGSGKKASVNQAFGVALQTLKPVLAVQLEQKFANQY